MEASQSARRAARRPVNWLLGALLVAGAFVTAWPIAEFGWYPALVGVSLMCFAAIAAVLYNAMGTIPQRVEAHRMELGTIVIATAFLLGLTFLWEALLESRTAGDDATRIALEGVGVMGILVLLGTMLGGNLLSQERHLTGHEVRTAIAVSVIAVFFGLIAIGSNTPIAGGSIIDETFAQFWKVLIAVVGFYFGSLAVEGVAANIKATNDADRA